MRSIVILPLLVLVCSLLIFLYHLLRPECWVVYYNKELPAEAFQAFDLIVFDSDAHPSLDLLIAKQKTLLAYISLGEVNASRKYYESLKSKGLFIKENKQWGSWVMDVRKPEWTAYVNEVLIPDIVSQGFSGIMIDTIDSVTDLEDKDPKTYAGMKQAAIQMIQTIRVRYPGLKIMLNRGFDILPQVVNDVDMVLAESVYTDVPPGAKEPVIVPDATYQEYVKLLNNARQQSSKLKIYTLDYWPPADKTGVKNIYKAERRNGFIPYVSTNDLQGVYLEP